jgi:hypothetical protein
MKSIVLERLFVMRNDLLYNIWLLSKYIRYMETIHPEGNILKGTEVKHTSEHLLIRGW